MLGALSLARTVTARVSRRGPSADLDVRDPDAIREALPRLWLLSSLWFRGEVRGLGHVPEEGPVLLVGNRSGGSVSADTGVLMLAFSTYFGVERRFHQLTRTVSLGLLRRFGAVPETTENAEAALRAGAAVLVYPGADHEAHRPSWDGARIDFGGRRAFVRLAVEQDVPIVPVVAIGGQETALFLTRGGALARLLRLDRLGLDALPISLAAPWGLNVGDLLGHLPLPAKIVIEVLPPLHPREELGDDPDVDAVYAELVARMQDALDGLAAERRWPVLG